MFEKNCSGNNKIWWDTKNFGADVPRGCGACVVLC